MNLIKSVNNSKIVQTNKKDINKLTILPILYLYVCVSCSIGLQYIVVTVRPQGSNNRSSAAQ